MYKIRLKTIVLFSGIGILLVITAYNLWAYQGTVLRPFLKDSATDAPHKPMDQVLREKSLGTPIPQLWVEIIKSRHSLTIYSGRTPLKSYHVALGKDSADKQKAGDRRVPAGEYTVTEKQELSPPRRFFGSRAIQLNYPNYDDAVRGLKQGIITSRDFLAIEKASRNNATPPQDTALGGGITIHGGDGPFMGDNWTNGSIGMYSKDAEEIFDYIPPYTKVVIRK